MSQRRKPLRTCLGCRGTVEQDRLVRLVLAPEGNLLVDYRHKLPGRGAYSCATKSCLELALKPGALGRAFRKTPPAVDVEVVLAQLKQQLRARIDNLIGMARKARKVTVGGNMVSEALSRGEALGCVILARDISEGIRAKIVRKGKSLPLFEPEWMDKECLGRILGRAECSVLGIARDSFAEIMLEEFNRYNNLAGDS
ncbi:MAG: DUF448 domain-containing protein [Deltaproteobacteria bacterium]|nr:MAG: DUF448 domain-containing protein [Deltaproteobacteria bacterium]